MADTIEESPVSYEELMDLEDEFEQAETEIIRQQYALYKPLFAKRAELVSQIKNFWPLVFEAAPMDIDEYIQPTDSQVILSSLRGLTVTRFELDADPVKGDPRSFAIRFEFDENEYFEDKVLEKKFWYRYGKDGFRGYVSEPVEIKWKDGKDLTDGLLNLAKAVYDEQKGKPRPAAAANGADKKDKKKEKEPLTEKQKALKEKIDQTGMGGVSFFCWFGYVGEYVTAEESAEAMAEEAEERRKRKAGEAVPKKDEDEDMEDADDSDDDDDDDDDDDLDIFPTGDAVALAIADDLYPGAIKYFIQAQEQDILSEISEEFDDEASLSDSNDEEEEKEAPKRKKQKA